MTQENNFAQCKHVKNYQGAIECSICGVILPKTQEPIMTIEQKLADFMNWIAVEDPSFIRIRDKVGVYLREQQTAHQAEIEKLNAEFVRLYREHQSEILGLKDEILKHGILKENHLPGPGYIRTFFGKEFKYWLELESQIAELKAEIGRYEKLHSDPEGKCPYCHIKDIEGQLTKYKSALKESIATVEIGIKRADNFIAGLRPPYNTFAESHTFVMIDALKSDLKETLERINEVVGE